MEHVRNFVVAIGSVCFDEYYHLDEWPQEGSKVMVDHLAKLPGGMIPNAACVFARYGVKTYLFDSINHSSDSQTLVADLEHSGVDTTLMVINEALPDPKCIIVLSKNERTIMVVDNHKPTISPCSEALNVMRNAAYIYSSASEMSLFNEPIKLINDLKLHGVKIVLDIEPTTVSESDCALIENADILFFNEFGINKIRGTLSEEEYLNRLFLHGAEIIVITLGANGCIVRSRNEMIRTEGISVNVIDPTGAGDTFNSSFIRCLLVGMSLKEASRFANVAASSAVTMMGARAGLGSVEEVEAMVKKYYGSSI